MPTVLLLASERQPDATSDREGLYAATLAAGPSGMSGARISPLAGAPLDPAQLINVSRLIDAYFNGKPDPTDPSQRVRFGTSGEKPMAIIEVIKPRLAASAPVALSEM